LTPARPPPDDSEGEVDSDATNKNCGTRKWWWWWWEDVRISECKQKPKGAQRKKKMKNEKDK
jgi:hypothetical protein